MAIARPRPSSVTVFGYLNIIFGVLWLLIYLCVGAFGIFFFNLMNSPAKANASGPDRDLELMKGMVREVIDSMGRNIPYYGEVLISSLIFSLLMTLVLIVAGIGLLGLKPWARITCLVYSVLTITVLLLSLGYTVAVANPNMPKVQQDMQNYMIRHSPPGTVVPQNAGGNPIVDNVFSTVGSVPSLIYPVLILIFMLLPGVKAAFRKQEPDSLSGELGRPGGPGADDDYFGYDRGYKKEDF